MKKIMIVDDDVCIGDMLEELLPLIRNIPVIVLSAKAAVSDKVELLLGGASDYITKPFDRSELLARIAVQLRKNPSVPEQLPVQRLPVERKKPPGIRVRRS